MEKPLSEGARQLKKLVDRGELAKRLDVSRQAVSSWLLGHSVPSPERMAELERVYGIPMMAWTEPATESDPDATEGAA